MKLNTLWLALFLLLSGGPASANELQEELLRTIERTDQDNVSEVAEILNKGADANDTEQTLGRNRTPLKSAIQKGKLKVAKLLLDKGADVNHPYDIDDGSSVLTSLCDRYRLDKDTRWIALFQLLVERGAGLNAQDRYGQTALMGAADHGGAWEVELLLEHGADKLKKNSRGMTALDLAKQPQLPELRAANDRIVKLLESDKPMEIEPVAARQRRFVTAISYGDDARQVAQLLGEGADASKPDMYGRSPLGEAAFAGNPEVVRLLLEKGADANTKNSEGEPSLMLAVDANSPEAVKLLLEKGADVNAKGSKGRTALMNATEQKHAEIVKLLLDNGADANAKDGGGWTALIIAVVANTFQGNRDVIKLLLDKGADVNAQDSVGRTALMMAVSDAEVVQLLLEHGANRKAKDENGRTALDEANKGYFDAAELLEDKTQREHERTPPPLAFPNPFRGAVPDTWKTECIGRYQLCVPGDVDVATDKLTKEGRWADKHASYADGEKAVFAELHYSGYLTVFEPASGKDFLHLKQLLSINREEAKREYLGSYSEDQKEIGRHFESLKYDTPTLFGWDMSDSAPDISHLRDNKIFLYGSSRVSSHGDALDPKHYNAFLRDFRTRALFEVPKEQGVCIPYGFIPDDGQQPHEIAVAMRLIDHPDVEVALRDSTYQEAVRVHGTYRWANVDPRNMINDFFCCSGIVNQDEEAKADFPRYHSVEMNGQQGGAVFVTIRRKDGSKDYGYVAAVQGTDEAPGLLLYVIRTASRTKGKPVGKDELQAMAWKIVASVKRHPVQ